LELEYVDVRIRHCMWSYFVLDCYDVRIKYCMWSYFVLDYVDVRIRHSVWNALRNQNASLVQHTIFYFSRELFG